MKSDRKEFKEAYGYVNRAYHAIGEIAWSDDEKTSDMEEAEELMGEITYCKERSVIFSPIQLVTNL